MNQTATRIIVAVSLVFFQLTALSWPDTFSRCVATSLEDFLIGEGADLGIDVTEDNITSYYCDDLDDSMDSNEPANENKSATSVFLMSSSDYYQIQGVEFKDAGNNFATGITENGVVSKVALTKISGEVIPAKVIVAVYEPNKKLRTLGMIDIDGDELEGEDIDVPITVNFGANVDGIYLKVFVWNSLSQIQPIAKIYQYGASQMTFALSAVEGQQAFLTICASGFDTFNGKTFTLKYNPDVLEVADIVALTPQEDILGGEVAGTPFDITAVSDGQFSFVINKTIDAVEVWNGLVNRIEFTGITTANTTVTVTIN